MLAAELARHKKKTEESAQPCACSESGPTSGGAPTASVAIPIPGAIPISGGAFPQISQSLPSANHLAYMSSALPPKPRPRPVRPPSHSLSELPILELPEASLTEGTSLDGSTGRIDDDDAEPETEESGGTSLFEIPRRQWESYQYAASAPASMLWGADPHKMGASAMGGRVASRTMLDALQQGIAPPTRAPPAD